MGQGGRILYMSHDSAAPSGGTKVIYSHVSHLVAHGLPASVVHNQADFRLPWLRSSVPTLHVEKGFELLPGDIVVIPEDHRAALEAFRTVPVTKYVFCQSYIYVFHPLQDGRVWEDFDITGVFCSSEAVRDFIHLAFNRRDVPVVHNGIPLDVFKPAEKRLQIAYMPRKRPAELEFIKSLFGRLDERCREAPWVPIDNADEATVAKVLGESAIFLSMSLYEGFGLPPLEAMACGCIVVGFHGYGGREYARPTNGFWCEEGELIECARTLARVVSLIDDEEETIRHVREEALKTSGGFGAGRQERELIDFWEKVRSGGG